MTCASLKYRWLVPWIYPVVGLVLGLADPLLRGVASWLDTKPGAATAVSVNLLMPLVAVVFGLASGRVRSAWLGAATMTLAFCAGLAIQYPAGIQDWSLSGVLRSVPPVLVVAALGYAVLGTIAAIVRRTQGLSNGSPVG